MLKIDVFRSLSLDSATLFAVVILLNLGALALSKLSLFEPSEPIATAVGIDTQHLIKRCQLALDVEIFDSRHRGHPGQGYIETSCYLPSIRIGHWSLPNLIQPELLAMLFYYDEKLVDAGIGVLQVASACGYKRKFGEDKEYPCLIE
jgi:hypothetical protein